jgi:hypothetical protein
LILSFPVSSFLFSVVFKKSFLKTQNDFLIKRNKKNKMTLFNPQMTNKNVGKPPNLSLGALMGTNEEIKIVLAKEYNKKGVFEFHNESGPAVTKIVKKKIIENKKEIVIIKETYEWRIDGKLHRESDLPAIEYAFGGKEWWINGKRREGEHAIETAKGVKKWFLNGKLGRDNDLPAIENPNGDKWWYKDGKRHREGDPAIVKKNGVKEWWNNGERHRENEPAFEGLYGRKEWYVNGKEHREDGPAIYLEDGTEKWFINGLLHRKDGPAVIYPGMAIHWYKNGKLHREDGFATEYVDGSGSNYINGVKCEN